MKKFILAAIATLSLGIGSAYAMQPAGSDWGQALVGSDMGQAIVGPAHHH